MSTISQPELELVPVMYSTTEPYIDGLSGVFHNRTADGLRDVFHNRTGAGACDVFHNRTGDGTYYNRTSVVVYRTRARVPLNKRTGVRVEVHNRTGALDLVHKRTVPAV